MTRGHSVAIAIWFHFNDSMILFGLPETNSEFNPESQAFPK